MELRTWVREINSSLTYFIDIWNWPFYNWNSSSILFLEQNVTKVIYKTYAPLFSYGKVGLTFILYLYKNKLKVDILMETECWRESSVL